MDLESTAGRAVGGKRLGKFTSDWTLCCIRKDCVINIYIYNELFCECDVLGRIV